MSTRTSLTNNMLVSYGSIVSTGYIENNQSDILLDIPANLSNMILNFEFFDALNNPVTSSIAGTLIVKGQFGVGRINLLNTLNLAVTDNQVITGQYSQLYFSISNLTNAVKLKVYVSKNPNLIISTQSGGASLSSQITLDLFNPTSGTVANGLTLSQVISFMQYQLDNTVPTNPYSVTSVAVDYTLVNTDNILEITNSNVTITLPLANSVTVGKQFTIKNINVVNTTVHVVDGSNIDDNPVVKMGANPIDNNYYSYNFWSNGISWRLS